ncbi:MAG: hypothetical protein F6K31_03160 [Symploca sp. SIO2G7]|nr:hypothetical protein [Symploca sp. SIO2G7]
MSKYQEVVLAFEQLKRREDLSPQQTELLTKVCSLTPNEQKLIEALNSGGIKGAEKFVETLNSPVS